jgi:hypothetical protein
MKLKKLREHYVSTDGGNTWLPKRAFISIDEIQASGLYKSSWHRYLCSLCNSWHVASRDKLNDND